MRPTALPLSCAQATANQLFSCNAIRFSAQSDAKLPASVSSASAVQYQLSWVSDRQEENTATKLGRSK